MSASNKKSWLLVAIGAAAALAAVVYGVRWISRQQTRKVVTEQVDEWERGWLAARACLVGDESTFPGAGHAYLLYEATHTDEPGREQRCEPLIRKLKRPGSESTGVAAVEKSWDNIRETTKKLSNAFVGVIDRSTYSPMGPRRTRLAEALDAMDAAHARLRQDSSMEPLPARGTMAPPSPLPEAVRPPGLDFLAHTIEVDNDALALMGEDGERQYRVVMRGPDQVSRYAYPRDNLQLAADEARWVVWSHADEEQGNVRVYAQALDDAGAPAGAETIAYAAPDASYVARSSFALGQGSTRAVFFELERYLGGPPDPDRGLYSVHSTDSGATWSEPVRVAGAHQVARFDVGGRQLDIVSRDPDGSVRWLPIQAENLLSIPKPRRLYQAETLDLISGCVRNESGWWLRDMSALYHVPGGESSARQIELSSDGVSLVDCTETQALLTSFADAGVRLHLCDARSCSEYRTVPMASQARHVVAMSRESVPVAVTQTSGLILVWRGDEPVRAYLDDTNDEIRELVEWDGVMHLVMTSEEGGALRVVPLT